MPQGWRWAVTLGFIALLALPVVRDGDGVPLSSYPMYAAPRASTIEFVVATGAAPDGSPVDLTIRQVASTTDPLVAEAYLRDVAADGRAEAACQQIAARIDRSRAAIVEVRRERHDVVAHASGKPSLLSSETLASCEIPAP